MKKILITLVLAFQFSFSFSQDYTIDVTAKSKNDYRISGEDLELIIIGVDKANRRKGLAKEMLIKLFSLAKRKKLKKIFLEVSVKNKVAINLYKRVGFKTYQQRENYYSKNRKKETALLMLKDIII